MYLQKRQPDKFNFSRSLFIKTEVLQLKTFSILYNIPYFWAQESYFREEGKSFVFPFPDRSRRSYRALTQTNFAIVPPAIWLPHLNNFIFARKKFLTWIRPGRLYLAGNLRKQFLYNWKTFLSGCLWSGFSFVAQWLEELLF